MFALLIRRGVARSGTMVMIGWCGGKLPLGPQLWKSSGVIYNVTTELWKDPTASQPAEPPEPSTPVRSALPAPGSAPSPAVSPPSATRDKPDELADLRRELVRTSVANFDTDSINEMRGALFGAGGTEREEAGAARSERGRVG